METARPEWAYPEIGTAAPILATLDTPILLEKKIRSWLEPRPNFADTLEVPSHDPLESCDEEEKTRDWIGNEYGLTGTLPPFFRRRSFRENNLGMRVQVCQFLPIGHLEHVPVS